MRCKVKILLAQPVIILPATMQVFLTFINVFMLCMSTIVQVTLVRECVDTPTVDKQSPNDFTGFECCDSQMVLLLPHTLCIVSISKMSRTNLSWAFVVDSSASLMILFVLEKAWEATRVSMPFQTRLTGLIGKHVHRDHQGYLCQALFVYQKLSSDNRNFGF